MLLFKPSLLAFCPLLMIFLMMQNYLFLFKPLFIETLRKALACRCLLLFGNRARVISKSVFVFP